MESSASAKKFLEKYITLVSITLATTSIFISISSLILVKVYGSRIDKYANDLAEIQSSLAINRIPYSVTPTTSSNTYPTPVSQQIKYKQFIDKDVYGISFKIPESWNAVAEKGKAYNTVGDRIVVMSNNKVVFQFLQIIDDTEDSNCNYKYCKLENVKLIGKTVDLDISGNTTNNGILPINPRLKNSGVSGYIQIEFSPKLINSDEDIEILKSVLESFEYN